MNRAGVGLPIVLVVTLVMAGTAIFAATRLRDNREQWMIDAARGDLLAMMDATDRYYTLYNALPRRLSDLNKVGFHESGGMIVCTFQPSDSAGGQGYLDLVIRHRAAERGAWSEYPSGQRIIKIVEVPECRSARRGRQS
jgi:hypothetical protein